LEESKSDLRRVLLTRRKTCAAADCRAWSRLIQSQALRLPSYWAAQAVALYSPIDNEVDTTAIAADALEKGKRLFYPKISDDNEPVFLQTMPGQALRSGRFGVLEPSGGTPIPGAALEKTVVFVPGVAFDRRGHRIGRGGGWYDRLLGQLARDAFVVGLAFDFQLVEELAADPWDQRVHCIITEKRVIDCGLSEP